MEEHNGTEFPIAFLSHTFTETQRKWSTTEQEAYGVYYSPHTPMFHLAFLQTQLKHPKPLTADRLEVLLQIQRTDPFCRYISKCLFNGKSPQHETDVFTYIKGLLYKHVMDSGKQFLALIIPKSLKYTVLVEAHDKLGHQGNSHTYCLIKRQYY